MPQLEVGLPHSQRDPGSCHQASLLATGLRLAALVPAPGKGKESVAKTHQHLLVQAWECAPEEWLGAGGQRRVQPHPTGAWTPPFCRGSRSGRAEPLPLSGQAGSGGRPVVLGLGVVALSPSPYM